MLWNNTIAPGRADLRLSAYRLHGFIRIEGLIEVAHTIPSEVLGDLVHLIRETTTLLNNSGFRAVFSSMSLF